MSQNLNQNSIKSNQAPYGFSGGVIRKCTVKAIIELADVLKTLDIAEECYERWSVGGWYPDYISYKEYLDRVECPGDKP